MSQKRIIRIPLPVDLIRSMDELIATGAAGFSTRTEFVLEAIEALMMEVQYEAEEPAEMPITLPRGPAVAVPEAPPGITPAITVGRDLSDTVLSAPSRGFVLEGGVAGVEQQPLYGLHNRDYPSFWALTRLARLAATKPVPAEDFLRQVTEEAWEFGESLITLERRLGTRLTPIFPTNRDKPQSAEEGFKAFAIGEIIRRDSGYAAYGPLFLWGACQLLEIDGSSGLLIGMTSAGYELLEAINGIDIASPHSPDTAFGFMTHLQHHAPADFGGFQTTLASIGEGATRPELLGAIKATWPRWTDAQIESHASGYVARSREWGFVAAKQSQRRYVLTEFGRAVTDGWKELT